jgi:uncharacterized membrane protein (DUF4010 family)
MMPFDPAMTGLFAALAAGLLIGLERGWAQRAFGAGHRVAGFRTFGLVGLAGGIAGLLPDLIAAVLLCAVALTLVAGYVRKATDARLSATTTISGVLTLAIGLAAVRLGPVIALAAAAGAVALLSARSSMHALLRGLNEAEVEAVARFALVALVVLPLLPDAEFGPYGAWNPRRIWMVVVMVTAFGLVGYVAARRFGSARSALVVAGTGALVSSTAVTADYARRLAREPEARGALTAGIALASLVMFLRVQMVTLALVPRALPVLALLLAPAAVVAALFALLAWRRQNGAGGPPVRLGNPFDFAPALLLAALVALFSLVAHWALERFGGQGIAVVLGLTGLLDVDAAVMTLSGMPATAVSDATAGVVLAVPVLANTGVKAVLAIALGGRAGGLRAALPLLAALCASLVALLLYALD